MKHFSILTAALGVAIVAGHPGHDPSDELEARRNYLLNNRGNLDHCGEALRSTGVFHRNMVRRSQLASRNIRSW